MKPAAHLTPPPPSPDPYVTYLAVDYEAPAQPDLTAQEIAQIRQVLNLVEPCQRRLVRYAFPANLSALILFFSASPNGAMAHPFGERGNVFYEQETGSVNAAPSIGSLDDRWTDIRYEIAHTACGAPSPPRWSPLARLNARCSGADSERVRSSEEKEMNAMLHGGFLLPRVYRVWKIVPEESSLLMVTTPFTTRAAAIRSIPNRFIASRWAFVFDSHHTMCGRPMDAWVAFVTPEGKELFTLRVDRGSHAY